MRILLAGKNDAAVQALEHMIERGDEVRAVGNQGDAGVDGWQRSLRAAASRHGVPFGIPGDVNDPAFLADLAAWRPELFLSIQFDQILKPAAFAALEVPFLNLHFSLLPRNRGVAPIAWAILNGDARTGATLHHMVPAIDAGDVVARRAVTIDPEDTARKLYEKVSEAAVGLLVECHPFERDVLERREPQDASSASYHKGGDLDFSRREVDWNRPADELQRWIRAMIFPPFQHPLTAVGNGRPRRIERIGGRVEPSEGAPPGTILSDSGAGMLVAARGGALRLLELAGPEPS